MSLTVPTILTEAVGSRVGMRHIFFFFTLVTGPRRSLRLTLSDTRVYEPQIRARLGTTARSHVGGWVLQASCSSSFLLLSSLKLSDTPIYAP